MRMTPAESSKRRKRAKSEPRDRAMTQDETQEVLAGFRQIADISARVKESMRLAEENAVNDTILAKLNERFLNELKLLDYSILYPFIQGRREGSLCDGEIAEPNNPSYTGGMDAAARIQAAAELLSTVYPVEHVRKALEDLAAKAARETTTRATATPRLKWDHDRLPDENPAAFAWRAYQAEAKAGTLHRGVIGHEDKPLAVKLASWLRSHPMPDGIDIPTLPEWNTRELAKRGGKVTVGRVAVRPEDARLYSAARYRANQPG